MRLRPLLKARGRDLGALEAAEPQGHDRSPVRLRRDAAHGQVGSGLPRSDERGTFIGMSSDARKESPTPKFRAVLPPELEGVDLEGGAASQCPSRCGTQSWKLGSKPSGRSPSDGAPDRRKAALPRISASRGRAPTFPAEHGYQDDRACALLRRAAPRPPRLPKSAGEPPQNPISFAM